MAPQIMELEKTEAGEILQAIMKYCCYGEDTDLSQYDRLVRSLWSTIKLKLDAGESHLKDISETNRNNVMKRWEKKDFDTTEYDCKQSNTDDTTEYDCTTITDTVTETNSLTTTISSVTKTDTTDSDFVDRQTASASASAEPSSGDLFSVKQLLATTKSNKVNLTDEGVAAFYEEMQESGWMMYQKPVEKKGIVRALRAYAKYHPEYSQAITEDSKTKGENSPQVQKRNIEDEIWDIASTYITRRRFDENPGGHRTQVGKYCPKEEFTDEQLEYMIDKWGIYPKLEKYVEIDEYWETED